VNKHWDIYAGVNYSDVSGGLASGFLAAPKVELAASHGYRIPGRQYARTQPELRSYVEDLSSNIGYPLFDSPLSEA
jgi:hypothetical protein